jgi:glutaredoxin
VDEAIDGGLRVITRSWRVLWFATLVLLSGLVSACHKKPAPAAAVTDAALELPVVTDASLGLLLTWLDEKGEFHTGEKVSDVSMVGRDQVRVEDPAHDDGSHPDRIFIVDLRTVGADGTYPVRAMKRADYEKLAEGLRRKVGPTLASTQAASAAAAMADAGTQPGTVDRTGAVKPVVIVYGASWCGACHQAMAYMKKKGIAFIDKDIEKDPGAEREMRSKLARAGINTGSIPILDVRGKILVGFSEEALNKALGAAM